VLAFPNIQDLHDLWEIKSICHELIQKHTSSNDIDIQHIIAFGGPMVYIFKNKKDSAEIIHNSLFNTNNIIQTFDISIIDHHILRELEFGSYWMHFQEVAKLHKRFITPFNLSVDPEVLNFESIQFPVPIMECYRDLLYERYPASESFKKWVKLAEKGGTNDISPDN
jgi:predicted metallo-beta-lactamase superfamily hydrolase